MAGHAEIEGDAGAITASGLDLFGKMGLVVESFAAGGNRTSSRILCRPCLDWSERRPHLAGRVGAALCNHCFEHGWIRRMEGTRAVAITPQGAFAMRERFGLEM